MAAAKALINDGSCPKVEADQDLCGDDATSYYTEFEYQGNRVIVASGIPNHDAEHDAEEPNPNTRCKQMNMEITLLFLWPDTPQVYSVFLSNR